MAAVTTSPPSYSARTTRATARFSATVSSRPARSKGRAWPPPTAPSLRSSLSRRPDMTTDNRFSQELREERNEQQTGTLSEAITGPVSDWATSFSHADPEWAADPFPIQDDLRQRCPVAHTERFGGVWLPTRYEDVASIAYDTERFSSRAIVISNFRPPLDLAPVGGTPPISSDPPFHHDARKLLLPAFTKTAISRYEESTRAYCNSLIDALDISGGDDVVDAAQDYAKYIPMRVIGDMLGLPQEDTALFAQFVEDVLETVDLPPEDRGERLRPLFDYLYEQVREHVANPRDDLTTHLINAELYGQKLDPNHVVGTIVLLMIAGIDTTWSAIGASLWHLAQHPEDRRRLATEPDLMGSAVEQPLSVNTPVTMARLVATDFDFHGHPFREGDWLLLPFPAANRDPAIFANPDLVQLDRATNRHAAFGLGRHRCLGSNLARMELRVALEEWLARYPDFELSDPAAVTWSAGQVRGPRTLPMTILGAARPRPGMLVT